jgi:hypothetical protein
VVKPEAINFRISISRGVDGGDSKTLWNFRNIVSGVRRRPGSREPLHAEVCSPFTIPQCHASAMPCVRNAMRPQCHARCA